MKIQSSVRTAFDAQLDLNRALLKYVEPTMLAIKEPRWHYEARLKELESFAVKLETGRVPQPTALEDFLACTLVVPNAALIPAAVSAIKKNFKIKYRRPRNPAETSKPANAFPFDDIRLYCVRGNDGSSPVEPIDDVVFEIQVKTFLQHAWSIATHDFNYKTDDVSWGKDRVVAHLKAALEHVELSVHEARTLALSPAVALKSPQVESVVGVVGALKKHWKRPELPGNLRGLAEAISTVLTAAGITASQLDEMLRSYGKKNGGLPLNLSPYGVVISALAEYGADKLNEGLAASKKPIVFLTPELPLPPGFPSDKAKSAVVQL